ncbi:hypothetical protein B4135_2522 [Caldibacillus debilis]|uniref:Uncharacterized protein n=1 Tax=Caldibacillus debilis TaxID=301148 RepID=A0A150LYV7_9BACI|nr:hypothetical protein B4135_2522 [Caldibacillus debilis]
MEIKKACVFYKNEGVKNNCRHQKLKKVSIYKRSLPVLCPKRTGERNQRFSAERLNDFDIFNR